MDEYQIAKIVDAIVAELTAHQNSDAELKSISPSKIPEGNIQSFTAKNPQTSSESQWGLDLPDLTAEPFRNKPAVENPDDPDGLQALVDATPARIGYGRVGPRYRTKHWLVFQADQAITQDTLYRDVDDRYLTRMGLFKVQTRISEGKQQYLLRPDLGRQLSEEAKNDIHQRCVMKPNIQVVVGDGLSAQAIEANMDQIMPVIQQGCQAAGLSMGTPFFVQYCRVGVMNDIGDILEPDVLMLLIGERPGLGRADSMSVYMGYRPHSGHSDADRDVICNVFNGGTNPLEAGAYAVQLAQKMIVHKAAGVRLKLAEGQS